MPTHAQLMYQNNISLMKKYIDADKLIERLEEMKRAEYENCGGVNSKTGALQEVQELIESLQEEQDMGEVSDGYHTFNELYYYRMLYNAAFFNLLPKGWVHKSKRHHTGEECFGGGWFIVMANLPTGQVSNHYELKDWDLFQVQEKEFADEWDGHTPQEAAKRLYEYLQQEQPEVDLEKFTEKIKTFQGRYKHPEIVSIKGAMAFMARMFYQYPNVARQWYEQLPKATMD